MKNIRNRRISEIKAGTWWFDIADLEFYGQDYGNSRIYNLEFDGLCVYNSPGNDILFNTSYILYRLLVNANDSYKIDERIDDEKTGIK